MRRLSVSNRGTSVLLVLLLCLQFSLAQTKVPTNASLEIIVKDPSGALIHRAQVELRRNSKPESMS